MKHESSLIQQLSSSDKSMKPKEALDSLLASGCSSSLQGVMLWLEIWGPGHKISLRAPLLLVGYIISSWPGRGYMVIFIPVKETKVTEGRESASCCGPVSLSGVTRRVRPQQTKQQRLRLPSSKYVSKCRILWGLQAFW